MISPPLDTNATMGRVWRKCAAVVAKGAELLPSSISVAVPSNVETNVDAPALARRLVGGLTLLAVVFERLAEHSENGVGDPAFKVAEDMGCRDRFVELRPRSLSVVK